MTSGNKQVIVKIGTEELDITLVPAVTLGDKRAMKAGGLKWQDIAAGDPDAEAGFVLLMLRKMRPATTEAEVDALSAKTAQDVLNYTIQRSAEVESPLSRSSTPLDGSTGGADLS